ncbi:MULTISPECIES: gamma-glutamyltransferase family protein [Roseobacteraceae]|uniref:Putative gamma-glutamyltransferase YwrD n=1 Tax=Pseudosulfitobacter pseudonitzschiae TaxID=1402135 RepID=A0A221K252_9RHOB|nr:MULTISPECIES: gamma-glutamyltransferase family protein [Roseobacteraceae]ASM73065.1 putative gamma-glutamyltransferase YwrD [Pseudosulfitobacter pseudonitzschiae]
MAGFTTRPEIRGTFGVATSTHWIASAVGFGILEKGGNAFDAAAATGFVLQIVEPHLNGPAGDLPVIYHSATTGQTKMICAQGVTPANATVDHYKAQGLSLIPGSGLLATVVPGAFDGWILMLRDHGTMGLRDVLQPAIDYARDGHPLLPRVANTIADLAGYFTAEWPTSAAVWTPDGTAPLANSNFKNPDLAATYERLVSEAEAASPDRVAQIDAAREIWSQGFVADAIFGYLEDACVHDVSGQKNRAVLNREDMANWSATYEDTLSYDYCGWTVHKTAPWSQGPVFLQTLAILKHFDLGAMDPTGEQFVHTVIEAMKLAFADREAYYGDPDHSTVPIDVLLSDSYNADRAKLVTARASLDQRPGVVQGFEHLAQAYQDRAIRDFGVHDAAPQEPTMAHLTEKRGDTVHLDVIDRWGNMVSATPSGGWLQSNPVIPGLGFPLNSRAQMFWLEEGLPTSLAPNRRPRTTLTPSLAEKPDGTRIVFGTPGGDQQDQWQLIWFLRFVHHGLDLQEGMDAPLFHSMHFQSSFFPRQAMPGEMMIEPDFGEDVIEALRARGHVITVAAPWSVGRMTAALRHPDGTLHAAATPRLMQAYAVGR